MGLRRGASTRKAALILRAEPGEVGRAAAPRLRKVSGSRSGARWGGAGRGGAGGRLARSRRGGSARSGPLGSEPLNWASGRLFPGKGAEGPGDGPRQEEISFLTPRLSATGP